MNTLALTLLFGTIWSELSPVLLLLEPPKEYNLVHEAATEHLYCLNSTAFWYLSWERGAVCKYVVVFFFFFFFFWRARNHSPVHVQMYAQQVQACWQQASLGHFPRPLTSSAKILKGSDTTGWKILCGSYCTLCCSCDAVNPAGKSYHRQTSSLCLK